MKKELSDKFTWISNEISKDLALLDSDYFMQEMITWRKKYSVLEKMLSELQEQHTIVSETYELCNLLSEFCAKLYRVTQKLKLLDPCYNFPRSMFVCILEDTIQEACGEYPCFEFSSKAVNDIANCFVERLSAYISLSTLKCDGDIFYCSAVICKETSFGVIPDDTYVTFSELISSLSQITPTSEAPLLKVFKIYAYFVEVYIIIVSG